MLTILAVLVILWLALHSGRIILAVFLALMAGLAITAALGLMMVGAFNLISVAFAVLFVGLGVDFFRFSPNIGPQSVHLEGCFLLGGCGSGQGGTGSFDIKATAISIDLMLRLPLIRTTDAPAGLLQPYIAVGRPLFFTTVNPRNTRLFRNHDSDTDLAFGYKAAGGLAFQVYTNLVVFGEYRFTHVATDVDLHDAVVKKATLRTELDTHSALFGISARW